MNRSDEQSSRHRLAWDLIPWVVNGRASADERRAVEQHLADCADCQAEHQFQSRLHAAMHSEAAGEVDHRRPLERLMRRIDADAEAPAPVARRMASGGLVRGLLAAVLVEAVGVAVLGTALLAREGAAPTAVYRTLSAPSAAEPPAAIRAVLAPELDQRRLQTLLARARLQIVGGPGESGVYSLAPTSSTFDTTVALALLRADPGVRLAEPVDSTPRGAK